MISAGDIADGSWLTRPRAFSPFSTAGSMADRSSSRTGWYISWYLKWNHQAHNSPSSPDLQLFANLSLLLDVNLPNALLPNLLKESFPNLVAHHDKLSQRLFGADGWSSIKSTLEVSSTQSTTWRETLSGLNPFDSGSSTPKSKKEQDPRDAAFVRGRWMWYLGAAAAMVTYVFASGLISIEIGGDEEDEEEEEEVWEVVGPDGEVLEEIEVVEVDEDDIDDEEVMEDEYEEE